MKKSKKTIWLVGGGTGGHISPAIAIAEEFVSRGHDAVLISIEKNRDYPSLVEAARKIPVVYYHASKIPKWPIEWFHFKINLFKSFKILNKMSRNKKPDAVIGFGGYPVFPALLWALLHRVPVYQHEQNSVHGLVTKLFMIFSCRVFLSFPSEKSNPKYILSGNPLRSEFLRMSKNRKPSRSVSIRKILIMGGSQGAKDLNMFYSGLIKDPFFKKVKIQISCGKQDFGQIQKIARKNDTVFPFIEKVPEAMLDSDLIITRSGSSSLFEALWSEKPVIFFPFPHATSDHQKFNANALLDHKKYFCVDIRPFNPDTALEEVKSLIEKIQSQKSIVKSKEVLPLNAGEIISDAILNDLSH